jgi:hypothetical protein
MIEFFFVVKNSTIHLEIIQLQKKKKKRFFFPSVVGAASFSGSGMHGYKPGGVTPVHCVSFCLSGYVVAVSLDSKP